jgi:hypothetical protein
MSQLRSRRLTRALAGVLVSLSAGVALVLAPSAQALTSSTPAGAASAVHSAGKVSTEAVVIAALAALLALGCVTWGIARLASFEPRWTQSLRHTMAEAGLRASATWAEFSDWVRLGH